MATTKTSQTLTDEQYKMATLKLLARQVELLEAMDWKLWTLHERFVVNAENTTAEKTSAQENSFSLDEIIKP